MRDSAISPTNLVDDEVIILKLRTGQVVFTARGGRHVLLGVAQSGNKVANSRIKHNVRNSIALQDGKFQFTDFPALPGVNVQRDSEGDHRKTVIHDCVNSPQKVRLPVHHHSANSLQTQPTLSARPDAR